MDISFNSGSGFLNIAVLCQVSFFILEAAKLPLNHYVLSPEAFNIHTLTNPILFYKVNVLLTCKRTSLIRIKDLWLCHFESFFQGSECLIEIYVISIDPCLIRCINDRITKQIRAYLSLLHSLRKVHLRIIWK